jgi:hypothetical protein
MLSSHICPGLPSGVLPLGLPTNIHNSLQCYWPLYMKELNNLIDIVCVPVLNS